MWSFKYPDELLHKTQEKEWFPLSNDHKESRLDSLEREEELHQTRMRRIAQTNAKPPIGISTKTKGTASATMSHQLDISVIEPQPRPRIWNNLAPETPRSEAQSSMMLLTDDSDSTSSSMMSSTQL
mmetsp:Transcript_19947/g.36220  ORF Transcript_19947/g.36220 Transcript_19947/m.36220 type:complete len:126 (+) Transcript_19947:57-434(+)